MFLFFFRSSVGISAQIRNRIEFLSLFLLSYGGLCAKTTHNIIKMKKKLFYFIDEDECEIMFVRKNSQTPKKRVQNFAPMKCKAQIVRVCFVQWFIDN